MMTNTISGTAKVLLTHSLHLRRHGIDWRSLGRSNLVIIKTDQWISSTEEQNQEGMKCIDNYVPAGSHIAVSATNKH